MKPPKSPSPNVVPPRAAVPKPLEVSASTLAVPIGRRALELLEIAYRARRPVLLEGPTGIGKSQIVAELARSLGIGYQVLDLSLLEPPDLVGLPVVEGGRTRYASPAELPTAGRGILMLEELNRAEIPVMQPALQLLSARRLHSYELPSGWSCIAAINPEGGDYQVNRLDPALRSRFLQLTVSADRHHWLEWAAHADVHPAVLSVVQAHDGVFDHASPRSWAYASEVLHALRERERADVALVRVALCGYLPMPWALILSDALAAQPAGLDFDAEQVLKEPGGELLADAVGRARRDQHTDRVVALSHRIRRVLAGPALGEAIATGDVSLAALESRLAALPGDLREQCLDAAVRSLAATALLAGVGYDVGTLLHDYGRSPLRMEITAWRDEMQLHRVRLVVHAVQLHLEATHGATVNLAQVGPAVAALCADAGSIGADLQAWLRAAGWSDDVR